MSEFVADFTCELCGGRFEPLTGGKCSFCGRLACPDHIHLASVPACEECFTKYSVDGTLLQLSSGHAAVGYLIITAGITGLAILLNENWGVNGGSTIAFAFGLLLLLASTRRPRLLYQVMRTGWFGGILNRVTGRGILLVVGLILVAIAVLTGVRRMR